MRGLSLIAPVLAIGLLAGCNQSEPAPVESEVTVDGPRDTAALEPDDQSLADPADDAVTAPATSGAIPAAMLGVWDSAEGACKPMSNMRLEIKPEQLSFYESLGNVRSVSVETPRAALVSLDMEGEGETWQQTLRLTLESDGERLTARDTERGPSYEAPRLKRCPR